MEIKYLSIVYREQMTSFTTSVTFHGNTIDWHSNAIFSVDIIFINTHNIYTIDLHDERKCEWKI